MSVASADPLQLAAGEIHSWGVPLDVPPDAAAGCYATLSDEERHRSAARRFERDRRRFTVAHGVLRGLLGRYLGIAPGRVRFVHNAYGKPELGPEFGGRLRFNLSHSADQALIAIAADADIGVDLECARVTPDYAEIARHFFSAADIDQLRQFPSHLRGDAFLRCWTKKEAYVKARGQGLSLPLASVSIPDLEGAWSFYTLQPVAGYVGALAIERRGWRLRQWQWRS